MTDYDLDNYVYRRYSDDGKNEVVLYFNRDHDQPEYLVDVSGINIHTSGFIHDAIAAYELVMLENADE